MNGNWIETYTGKRFDFDEPLPDMICVEDIAHSLAMQCRFNGHTQRFYSVAEHSILLCMAYVWGNEDAFALLLHDSSEAYVGDMASPLKHMLPQFQLIEARVERAIAAKFGLVYPHPDVVKSWDSRIILDERAQAMNRSGNKWPMMDGLDPLGVRLQFWQPKQAEDIFLQHFHRLSALVKPKEVA